MAAVATGYFSTYCHDPDMTELIELFVQEMPDRLAVLEQHLEEANWSELARFAHQLKGAGGSYGFPQLTPVASRLEQLAKHTAPAAELEAALHDLVLVAEQLRTGAPEPA
ncbi:Hpt domain-containing protein [Anatilimnocola floriformis]|uniref:Hpt domain-containing protein n=1 Tax=Anatilimnocola floriformis TaxID=2948575 RepID=UPI0020C344D3|nr:Hpt domain-containing protein [Anatilimnocola floriformis]